jgi:hypothetical protein
MRKNPFLLPVLCFFLASCAVGDSDSTPVPLPVDILPDMFGMAHTDSGGVDYDLMEEMGIVWMLQDWDWDDFEPEPPTYREAWDGHAAGTPWQPADGVTDAILANLDHHWNETYKVDYLAGVAAHPDTKSFAVVAYGSSWVNAEGSLPPYEGKVFTNAEHGEDYISVDTLPLYYECVKAMAKKYYKTVGAFNIWNEPDNRPRFWIGTDEEYYNLVKTAAQAIRAAEKELNAEHPGENIHLTIVGGAFFSMASADFMRGMFEFENGIIGTLLDAVAYHPYAPTPQSVTQYYNKFKAIAAPYGFGDKIWVTEEGFPTSGTYGWSHPESTLPENLVKTITLLAANGAKHIFWYCLYDSKKLEDAANTEKSDAERWFGLVVKGTPKYNKLGANAYALCARYLPGYTWQPSLPKRSGLSKDIQSFYFEKPDGGAAGSRTLILWNDKDTSVKVKVTLPGNNWLLHDPGEREFESAGGTNQPAPPADIDGEGRAVVTVTKTPVILTWQADAGSPAPKISAP